MQLGDCTAEQRTECARLDAALNVFDSALDKLINTIEAGGLEHLSAAEKISFWQRFETFRNRLPLIDHALIADAEAKQSGRRVLLVQPEAVVEPDAAAVPGRSGGPGSCCGSA